VINATFSNISAISWRPLLVKEAMMTNFTIYRKNKTAVTDDQLLAVPPAHEYANEGSFESDVKSYAYVDIDKKNDKDKFSTSVRYH
jgi:hypothetical protein